MKTERLSIDTLRELSTAIKRPSYEPVSITSGIVHFGVGNFHRAHQAVYCDTLLNQGETKWGITGISMRSPGMRDNLTPQNYLYTLATLGEATSYRIIGAICNGSNSVDHPLRSGLETMMSILCIQGDRFPCRSSYHESFVSRAEAAKNGGWCMATEAIWDAYIPDLEAKGNTSSALYKALSKWQSGADVLAGIVLLHEKMKALLLLLEPAAMRL